MEEKQYRRVIGASISLACHIVAFFQFRLNLYSLEAGIRWSVPFYILLGLSLLLAIVLFFLRNKYADLVLLLIRIPLLIQIGYPLGDYIGIDSSDNYAHAIWTDTRRGEADAFTAVIVGDVDANSR